MLHAQEALVWEILVRERNAELRTVDRNEDCSSSSRSHGEEDEHSTRSEELDWENAAIEVSEDSEDLLDPKDDEENT